MTENIKENHSKRHQIRNFEFFTDGAYSSKTQMGGWSFVCVENEAPIDIQSGYEPFTTNNRMELLGVIRALRTIYNLTEQGECRLNVKVCTDSAYVANCINERWYLSWMHNGWRTADKHDIKNQDLWAYLIVLYRRLTDRLGKAGGGLSFERVAGHADNYFNNLADKYAVEARCRLEN